MALPNLVIYSLNLSVPTISVIPLIKSRVATYTWLSAPGLALPSSSISSNTRRFDNVSFKLAIACLGVMIEFTRFWKVSSLPNLFTTSRNSSAEISLFFVAEMIESAPLDSASFCSSALSLEAPRADSLCRINL